MSNNILSHFHVSDQELVALSKVIQMSFTAFKRAGYPRYFYHFLAAILQIVQLGAAAVTQTTPPELPDYQFSMQLEQLASFLREAQFLIDRQDK